MLQEPDAFQTAVHGLLRAQKQAIEANSNAGGEHLCFMGSGRLDEDQYMHMVVASFLQKNTQYVSLLTGGYASIHDYFGYHMIDCLEDHDPQLCLMCDSKANNDSPNRESSGNKSDRNRNSLTSSTISSNTAKPQAHNDLFSKLSNAMKTKSADIKGKFYDYLAANVPSNASTSTSTSATVEKHVSSSEKYGKRYRNVAPVFSIDEDNCDGVIGSSVQGTSEVDENQREIVQVQNYVKNPDVITSYKCQEVHMNGYMYESYLIITKTHLIVLRDLDKKGTAQVIVRRPLSSIVKITAKKRHRDLITFKYGIPDGDQLLITDMDRFLIPNASEATALVSKQIINQLDNAPSEKKQ